MSDDVVNHAARVVASMTVKPVTPLTHRLGDYFPRGASMTKHTKRFRFNGARALIAEILAAHPDGLGVNDVHSRALMTGKFPQGWLLKNTAGTLSHMRSVGQSARWPGRIWKLGPNPVRPSSTDKPAKAPRKSNGADHDLDELYDQLMGALDDVINGLRKLHKAHKEHSAKTDTRLAKLISALQE